MTKFPSLVLFLDSGLLLVFPAILHISHSRPGSCISPRFHFLSIRITILAPGDFTAVL
jgi:hypothetical protein